MKSASYIIISHRNGKQKIYTAERYKLIKVIKFGLTIAISVGVMLLMCGMVAYDNSPVMPLQLVIMSGIGLFVLIALIYSYVSDKEPCQKQGNNKNSNHRRKTK